MEMSPRYLRETVEQITRHGWAVREEHWVDEVEGVLAYTGLRYVLDRGPERLTLECLQYPGGAVDYYLALDQAGSWSARSYPLDSWKWRADRVEFKFGVDPQRSKGLALTLWLRGA